MQDNIKNFEGNPNKVTLLGQSSGGTNIFSLLSSPASRGLFHAAISLSGSPNITMGLPQAYDQNKKIVEALGCNNKPDVLGCLYNTSASDIAKKIQLATLPTTLVLSQNVSILPLSNLCF